LNPYKKDTLVSHYIDGLTLPVGVSEVNETWRLRYDKVCLSLTCPAWMLDNDIKKITSDIKNLDYGFTVRDHECRSGLYKRLKKFSSDSHQIEIFYNRNSHRPEIDVAGYIRVTVRNKNPESYLNHAYLLLALENLLSDYWFHLSLLEVAWDCLDRQEFKEVNNKVFLKYSKLENWFSCDGSRSEYEKILRIPSHDTTGTKYFNGRESTKQVKIYTVNEDTVTEIMESRHPQNQDRMRIELSFKRSWLRRKNLNTFFEILEAGPDLFFNQLELVEFDKSKISKLRTKSFEKSINELLCKVTEMRLDALLKKPSTEIVKKLSDLLPWTTYRIKKQLGKQLEFPDFIFDAPYGCNNNVATKYNLPIEITGYQ
jgi:hypothetical protein